ncbi:uncharacterized protein (TIGR03578 family) [Streptomyces sp. 840.1]|uniref:DUF4312 family protein n=1 Tax=Streptomyces sp. 840.1 TaxID=2485152 RepID=UPI000F4AD783|nr:DUF4312 family protein [Streptomyces sp. 840.1]ROQ60239.1 uncharacterized protein (TIGR03578 family) [Streptomyces sp. 840.1]
MNHSEQTLRLTGTGPTKERAFGAVMRQVQSAAAGKDGGVTFRVEPLALEVLSAEEHHRTERFLGVLFPRKRVHYEISMNVRVRITSLDLDAVDFAVREEKLSTTQHLLQMR